MCYRVSRCGGRPRSCAEAPRPSGVLRIQVLLTAGDERPVAPGRSTIAALFGPFTSESLVEQREGPERHPVRHLAQVGIAGAFRIDATDAADHRDILLAVLLPGDGLADDAGWRLEAPQHLAGLSVERLQL